jgi:hypothetical protein
MIEKLKDVMDLLGTRTLELEKRIEAAEILIDHMISANTNGPLEPTREAGAHKDGGYPCKASRTMLMFCILGLVATALPVSASPASSEWKTSTREAIVRNKMSFVDPGMFSKTVEIMYEVHGEGEVCYENSHGPVARPHGPREK